MSRKMAGLVLASITLAGLGIWGCSKDNPTTATPPPVEQVAISDQVEILPDSTFYKLDHVDSTSYTYYFDKTAASISLLQPGQLIISAIGEGTLRKVKAVNVTTDYYVVQTDTAMLEEVITQGGISAEIDLTPSKVAYIKTAPGVTVEPNSKGTGFYISFDQVIWSSPPDQIKISGNSDFNPSLKFGAKFADGTLDTMGFYVNISRTANLTITATEEISGSGEVSIATFMFSPIITYVGIVPVVIIPYMEVILGADISMSSSLTTGLTYADTIMGGIKYKNSTWSPIAQYAQHFGYTAPTLSAGIDLTGYILAPKVGLHIYGLAGPTAKLKAYGRIHSDVFANPWWQYYAGLTGTAGVETKILNLFTAGYSTTIFNNEWLIAQATTTGTGTITGRVTDAATTAGISGATVATSPATSTVYTDASGYYTISSVAPATYTVTASKTGYSSNTGSATVTAGNTTTTNIALTANPTTGTITGRITDAATTAGISGATVTTSPATSTVYTDASGYYTINSVAPATYTVTASKTGYSPNTGSATVTAGNTTTTNIALTANPTVGTITGRITDAATTAGISGATVTTSPATSTVTTDASGYYTISSVAPATYTVTASKTGYSSNNGSATVTAGNTTTTNIALTANPTVGTITGRITDASTTLGISGATVTTSPVTSTVTTDASGYYTINSVAPATYTVTASKTGYSSNTGNATVTAGYTTITNIALTIVSTTIEWISISAGNFKMGSLATDPYAYTDEQPQHLVYLDAYQISKYEVTNSQYKAFMDAGGYSNSAYWTTEGWSWRTTNSITEPYYWTAGTYNSGTTFPNHPVVGVSWYEAYAFCNWAGGHLPTEAQWEKASRGTDSSNYWPWGSVWDASKCNSYYNTAPDTFAYSSPVGFFSAGTSPYSVYDMAGNVWEWVNDWYQSDYYSVSPASNPAGPTTGSNRVIRGGSFYDGGNYCRSADRDDGNPGDRSHRLGFRLAK